VPGTRTPLRAARLVFLALAVTGGAVLLTTAGPASAAPAHAPSLRSVGVGSEQITSYGVDLMVKPDGSMHVQETIAYDFGFTSKHGIERTIPVSFTYDDKRDRRYPLSNITVSSPTGAPDDEKTLDSDGPVATIRIGDPNNANVTGKQTYVINYDVGGVVNSFSDHQELYWNAIGNGFTVPIDAATVTVEGPAAVRKVACFEGSQGSTDTCAGTIGSDGAASFTGSALDPQQGLTVVASFPVGTFPHAAPILKERQTLARAFSLTPVTGAGGLALLALLGGGAIATVSRRGRDERYLGLTPGLQPGYEQQATVSRVPWLRRDPVAVQFTPPDGMRPGQLGTLIDEHANVVDVTATIVDLAVRGFLRIEEVEQPGMFRSGDWRLVELAAPAGQLHDYETKLYNSIFRDRAEVLLSDLKQTFKSDLESVQSMLYADVTSSGWFHGNLHRRSGPAGPSTASS